jgi:phosphate transport system substrate-binding protein
MKTQVKQMQKHRINRALAALATTAVLAVTLPHAARADEPSEPENAKQSIWTLNVTKFRKEHALEGGYTRQWDLSDLPHYVPRQQLTGTLRIWGSNYLKDGPLGEYWREAFKKFQPGITIEYNLPTSGIAVTSLAAKVSDLAVGRPATLVDLLTFEQVYGYPPTEIIAMTGSYDVYGWSPAFIIVVHKDNPLDRISVKQLDGVFGAARLGGYDGSTWRTDYPYRRGAEEDIRTWGQLGLKGEWAGRPIHPCGQTPRANIQVVFSNLVLRGSEQWVEGYRAFANYATRDGNINPWSLQVRHAVEQDPYALCIVSPLSLSPDLKELAVQPYAGGAYVKRSLETVRDHSYPLDNEVYFYLDRAPGKSADPRVEEFLRFVLSQEGQEQVQREGRYLPLTAEIAKAQLAKLGEQ